MAVFAKPELTTTTTSRQRKREMPQGLFTKCPACGELLLNKELEENLMVCKACGHSFPMSAALRVASLIDEGSWQEFDSDLSSVDVLKFTGATSYADRLTSYQKRTGLKDAVVSGTGTIDRYPVSLAIMDFAFLGGSMGSVVGEKITRALERAVENGTAGIVVCASGGARMHESMFSLMQMAKTSGAVQRMREHHLPFLSILTNPTMGGVTASFAALGDVIIAEPKAMVGFAGARVIRDTTQQELPEGFQTAEFLLDRGLIDLITPRAELQTTLARILSYISPAEQIAETPAPKEEQDDDQTED